MTTSVISATYSALANDSTLMALAPGGVHTTWSTEGELPRILLGYSFTRDTTLMRVGSLDVDVFYHGNDVESGELIRDRVIQLIENRYFRTDETGRTLRATLGTDSIIREDDPQIGHWSMSFDIRFFRREVMSNG